MPLGVGGPPAGNFIFWWVNQDTHDTQDTQDGGKAGLRASERLAGQKMAYGLSNCPFGPVPSAKHQAGAVLGVLGVLGVLAKALEREAA